MNFTGGYESDLKLDSHYARGNVSAQNSRGSFGVTGGTGNNYFLAIEPPIQQYLSGMVLEFSCDHASTGPVTLNVSGLGAVAVKKVVSGSAQDLAAGELAIGQVYRVVYLTDHFQLVGCCSTESGGGGGGSAGPASESTAGIAAIATQGETTTGTNDSTIVTPLKLEQRLSSRTASESHTGLVQLATQPDLAIGTDDSKAITPLKLKNRLSEMAATEGTAGLAVLATTMEVAAGADDNKVVTPLKLAQYVADKITGLWKDKGILDCTLNPNYPAGQKGDAYTVSIAGRIGGADGKVVQVRDVVYCTATNGGGSELSAGESWNVIQANLVQATEVLVGFARIATQDEVNTGTDDSTYVTPLKLLTLLNTKIKTKTMQLTFTSETMTENTVGPVPTSIQETNVNITGLLPHFSLGRANVIWEGYVRNTSTDQSNRITSGHFYVEDNASGDNFTGLNLVNRVLLEPAQTVFVRLCHNDITGFFNNGSFLLNLDAISADRANLAFAGRWIIELTYQSV